MLLDLFQTKLISISKKVIFRDLECGNDYQSRFLFYHLLLSSEFDPFLRKVVMRKKAQLL